MPRHDTRPAPAYPIAGTANGHDPRFSLGRRSMSPPC
jgi:hypothetical protein